MEVLPETVSSLAARLAAEPDAAAVCPLPVTAEGEPAPELFRLPLPATVSGVARAGAFSPASPDLAPGLAPGAAPGATPEKVVVEFPSFSAFMVRSYFLKGLRYIDDRYAQSWADAELAFQIRRAAKKILLYPGIRVTQHGDDPLRVNTPPAIRALLASDWALGGAAYAGKHFGFMAGLKVRLAAIFGGLGAALLALVRFRDAGYHLSRFIKIATGAKVDGTQSIM
jgi:hypothetical protein